MKKGFLLVISIMIAAVVLTVGLGAAGITYKEIIISSFSKESQKAFYAADSGIECALYWDLRWNGNQSAFATSTSGVANAAPATSNLPGNNQDITDPSSTKAKWAQSGISGIGAITDFEFSLATDLTQASGEPYVIIRVEKKWNDINNDNIFTVNEEFTTIISYGYNVKEPTNPRRVNRSIVKTY